MLTLGIETATNVCSVALMEDDRLVLERSVDEPRSHASQLVPMIREILDEAGKKPADVNLVGVSGGPGSYTGLRIGASTAKGLAVAVDAQLVAVPSLEALAWTVAPHAERFITPLFPSRRGEVYAAVYEVIDRELAIVQEPAPLSLDELSDWLPDEGTIVAVPSASGLINTLPSLSHPVQETAPSAASVAELGHMRWKSGEVADVAAWEPFYLKTFVAKPPKPIF